MQETQKTRVQSLGWEDPEKEKWWTTPVFLPGESHGQQNLVGYRPQGRKKSDMTECLSTCFAHNKALNIYQAKF